MGDKINVLMIIAAIIFVTIILAGYLECSASGGDYVRTLFWYTCIKE